MRPDQERVRRDALEAAFRATTYRVWMDGSVFDLRVGERHPSFDAALTRQGVQRWALVSACNPGAQQASAENAQRTARLLERLATQGLAAWPALNTADAGDWPDEVAVLLPGADEETARALGAEFAQEACLCGRCAERAYLVWCMSAEGPAGEKKAV